MAISAICARRGRPSGVRLAAVAEWHDAVREAAWEEPHGARLGRHGEEGVRRASHAARTEEQVAAHVRRRPARRRAAAAAAAAAAGTGRFDWVGPTWYGHR